MSEYRKNPMLSIPIDPNVQSDCFIHRISGLEESTELLKMTDACFFPSEFFVVLRAISRVIFKGTEWNKKARIVFEYDPQQKKMTVSSFMESGELSQGEGQE